LDHQNNYVKAWMSNAAKKKNFNILTIGLNVLHNYLDGLKKNYFRSVSN